MKEKRQQEQQVIQEMIYLYCKKKHGHKETLCRECQELLDYANQRIEKCPKMEMKTFCSNCNIHCYKKDMREKVKAVMRYSGPRMLIVRPIMVLKHIKDSYLEKRKQHD